MFCKNILIAAIAVFVCQPIWASSAQSYLTTGKAQMFAGTQSGLRQAYQTFDNGLKDAGCTDCASNRELRFLHAVTRTAMLGLRDDGGSIDSIMEMARTFGVTVVGDSLDPNKLSVSLTRDEHDLYKMPPADASIEVRIRNFIDTAMIPEIDAILSELNLISDSPSNRFRIYFQPSETGLLTPLEVDYAEVLALKGILKAARSQLRAKLAYDTYLNQDEKLIEKLYGKCFSMQDLLDRYPNLLKVGPTSSYSENGTAELVQARQDWIEDCNSLLAVINYISTEDTPAGTDPQTDELLYIDPNNMHVFDDLKQKLETLMYSLQHDSAGTYIMETTDTYMLMGSGIEYQMELTTGFMDQFEQGKLILISGFGVPSNWDIDWLERDGSSLLAGLSSNTNGWFAGTFSANISSDNVISSGTLDFWGDYGAVIYDLAGSPTESDILRQFDPNPILGSSGRYPFPVNLRDLLPDFDFWNAPLPNTIGHGLNNDAKLGGITPDMTQKDWQIAFDLQPSGPFVLNPIAPWQLNSRRFVGVWQQNQKVFADISGDTEKASNLVAWTDIKNLYMGYDQYNLYGTITCFNNTNVSNNYKSYNIYLSYSSNDKQGLGSIRLHISGEAYGYLEQEIPYFGYTFSEFPVEMNQQAINFAIPWNHIPDYLFGRFLSIDSHGFNSLTGESDGEDNVTHLQMSGFGPIPQTGPVDELGIIGGIVDYDDYQGAPIFVQAYTDPQDPEGSIVASTILAEPGPYMLDGIGLGWSGYVRAFTPLFGFNMFDDRGLLIKSAYDVYAIEPYMDYVDFALSNPVILENHLPRTATLVTGTGQEDMYAFDAIAGAVYHFSFVVDLYDEIRMSLYGRNGSDEIQNSCCSNYQYIDWQCPLSGRYFVGIHDNSFFSNYCNYTLTMSRCPIGDISGPLGFGASDCSNNFYDLEFLLSQWLAACGEPNWCSGADLDRNTIVNIKDLAILAQEWLKSF